MEGVGDPFVRHRRAKSHPLKALSLANVIITVIVLFIIITTFIFAWLTFVETNYSKEQPRCDDGNPCHASIEFQGACVNRPRKINTSCTAPYLLEGTTGKCQYEREFDDVLHCVGENRCRCPNGSATACSEIAYADSVASLGLNTTTVCYANCCVYAVADLQNLEDFPAAFSSDSPAWAFVADHCVDFVHDNEPLKPYLKSYFGLVSNTTIACLYTLKYNDIQLSTV